MQRCRQQTLGKLSLVFLFFSIATFSACDPGYSFTVQNKRNDTVFIYSEMPLDQFYHSNFSELMDLRRKTSHKDSLGNLAIIYPNETMTVFVGIGFLPKNTFEELGYLRIYSKTDTVIINKDNIVTSIKGFSGHYTFYIK